MIDSVLNTLLFRKCRANLAGKKFIKALESELAEGFLDILLNLMGLMFCIDKSFKRNIENFDARYTFKDKSGDITVSAIFENSKLKVIQKDIDNTNITIIFKDQKALMNFLLSPKPDILSAILNQDVTYEGNLNYLSKFAYMATHLVYMFTEHEKLK
ncbi:MAG: hypothetical protein ACM3KR_04140 [Deltaproteobacteria bacterium]